MSSVGQASLKRSGWMNGEYERRLYEQAMTSRTTPTPSSLVSLPTDTVSAKVTSRSPSESLLLLLDVASDAPISYKWFLQVFADARLDCHAAEEASALTSVRAR